MPLPTSSAKPVTTSPPSTPPSLLGHASLAPLSSLEVDGRTVPLMNCLPPPLLGVGGGGAEYGGEDGVEETYASHGDMEEVFAIDRSELDEVWKWEIYCICFDCFVFAPAPIVTSLSLPFSSPPPCVACNSSYYYYHHNHHHTACHCSQKL